ncbi:MAG: hypothetical protein CMB65_05735 [Euryarchaeota archaeon]|nr:hypothetical protein [Euryarchaeota archaeon]
MMPGERGMHMDWTNVELVNIPDDGEQVESEPILAGLSASPSDLHGAFLTDLPHLQEAQIAHATLMATAGKEVEAHFSALSNLQTADAAVAALGGFREGDALVLPLQGAIQDHVKLEVGTDGVTTAIRLQAEAEDGANLVRTFTLPPGCQLAQAGWRGNSLILNLNRD